MITVAGSVPSLTIVSPPVADSEPGELVGGAGVLDEEAAAEHRHAMSSPAWMLPVRVRPGRC